MRGFANVPYLPDMTDITEIAFQMTPRTRSTPGSAVGRPDNLRVSMLRTAAGQRACCPVDAGTYLFVMPDDSPTTPPDATAELLRWVERSLSDDGPHAELPIAEFLGVLDWVERETPRGAPLHTQLDTVRKWLGALAQPETHERFGGADHLRAHVLRQLRVAIGAYDDYRRESR